MFEHGLSFEKDEKEDKGDYNQGDNVKAACLGIILPVVGSIYVNYFDLYCRISFQISFFIFAPLFVWNFKSHPFCFKLFRGNDDKNTLCVRHLRHPVTARYVRIRPLFWHGVHICMRAQIYGCDYSGKLTIMAYYILYLVLYILKSSRKTLWADFLNAV